MTKNEILKIVKNYSENIFCKNRKYISLSTTLKAKKKVVRRNSLFSKQYFFRNRVIELLESKTLSYYL